MTDSDTLAVSTTLEQRMVGVRAVTQRLQRVGGAPWRKLVAMLGLWMAVGALVGFFGAEMKALPGGQWLPLVALVLVFIVLMQRAQGKVLRRVSAQQPGDYQLTLADEALVVVHAGASTQLQWQSVVALERIGDLLLIHLSTCDVLTVPLGAVGSDAWLGRLESLSGCRVTVGAVPPPEPDAADQTRPWRDLFSNLTAGVGLLWASARATARLKVSAAQLVWLLLVDLLLIAFGNWLLVGTDSQFNRYGMASAMFWVPLLLLAAWASARAADDDRKMLPGAVALVAVGIAGTVVQYAAILGFTALGDSFAMTAAYLYWGFVAWLVIASIVALARAQQLLPEQRMGAVLAVLGLLIAPQWLFKDNSSLWVPPYDETAAAASEAAQARYTAVTHETMLYTQPALLDEALAGIAPGRPGVPELFVLSVGGHGNQDVFLREVRSVDTLFRERFDAEGRSLVLVNNPATVDSLPIASVTALARSLKVFGQRMNADEDVLVVFLTSHGSEEHRFDLSLWPFSFDELTPEVLRSQLDAAGIRYRALIVSACFSGGFVPALADTNTLVMTASRADRNSHGCSHSADWTFFGRALFNEALRETYSFEAAFTQASAAVAVREAAEGYDPSEPQIALGEAVAPVLTAIERRLQVENMGQRKMAGAAAVTATADDR